MNDLISNNQEEINSISFLDEYKVAIRQHYNQNLDANIDVNMVLNILATCIQNAPPEQSRFGNEIQILLTAQRNNIS